MTNDQLWQAVLGELELLISRPNFTTWFKNTFVASRNEREVVVGVPNTFTKTWLETKYHASIIKALSNITGESGTLVVYRVEAPKPSQGHEPPTRDATTLPTARPARAIKETVLTEQTLNPRYTFDNFITGKSNELAKAACLAVVEKPGVVYNPLFIYGGAGLGKTHLMQAIGHAVLSQFSDKQVLYVTSEKFTNDFIQAISRGHGEKFKSRYRSVDLLLVDDIQFLAGKEGTQEEFFHTFNALHQTNRQIVVTSDRPPKSIPALENRLLSRFEWGMIADITSPDFETRVAILDAKCKERSYHLSPDVINYIATTIHTNIRELEGALNRVVAFHQLSGSAPTLDSAKHLLASVAQAPKRGGVSPKRVIQVVAEFYDLKIPDIMGDSRKKELVLPRQIAMYLMREELQTSFPSIGAELGDRDHTTAMYACTKIAKQVEADDQLKQNLALILQRLYNS